MSMSFTAASHTFAHTLSETHDKIMRDFITEPKSGTHSQSTIVALEYAKLVCKELRGASYALRDHKSVHIFRKGETFTLGWVGYGDYLTVTTKPPKFVVYCPFHTNCKYNSGSDQHHMSMFDDRAKAINKAKALFRSYTVAEAACAANPLSAAHITDVQGSATKDVRSKAAKLELNTAYQPTSHRLLNEFKEMMRSGYQFLDPQIGIDIKEFCNAFSVHTKRSAQTIPVMYVDMITDRFGDNVYRLARLKNGRVMHPNPYHDVTSEEHCTQDEVPQWAVDRVATLQIVDNGTYVEGVGYKHCNTAFTIHVDDVNPFVDDV